ncbi:hypothetical protein HKD37_17G048515 [Glycine soja]
MESTIENVNVLMMLKRIHLIMIFIINKGENMNITSTNIQMLKHCFKINTRLLQQTSIASRLIQNQAFASKQIICFATPLFYPPNKGYSQSNVRDHGAHLCHANSTSASSRFGKYIWCPMWGRDKTYPAASLPLMVGTWSGLKSETPLENSNPPPTTMIDIDTLHQLQTHIREMEHKPGKHQPLPREPKYERYTPLTTNQTTILEEAFNTKVPIKLPPPLPPRMRLDKTKYCRYHRTQFVKRFNNQSVRARLGGQQEDQHKNLDADTRRDQAEDRGKQRHHQQRRKQCFNKQSLVSRFTKDQALPQNKGFQSHARL